MMGGGDTVWSDDVCGLMFDSKWERRRRVGVKRKGGREGRKGGGV